MLTEPQRQILVRAKTRIVRGWRQGKFIDGWGRVCLWGGLYHGCGRSDDQIIDYNDDPCEAIPAPLIQVAAALAREAGVHVGGLWRWNDQAGTTKDDVVNLIDRVLLKNSAPKAIETEKVRSASTSTEREHVHA